MKPYIQLKRILGLAYKRGSNSASNEKVLLLLALDTYRFYVVERKIPPSLGQISQGSLPSQLVGEINQEATTRKTEKGSYAL